MDDTNAALHSQGTQAQSTFRCPGETHPIGRAVHLGRLASFYPACLNCEHRHDTSGLSALQLRDRLGVERRISTGPQWKSEGLYGSQLTEIDVDVAGRFAGGVANEIWRRGAAKDEPAVLVGSDGTWHTADQVPALCRTLELSGLRAVEVGAATTAALAHGIARSAAAGGIWIGNATGEPHSLALRAWHGATPMSRPGSLDGVREAYQSPPRRDKRTGGRRGRLAIEPEYLQTLRGTYHGLRPLSFVLDTACGPLVRYWQSLAAEAACRFVVPEACGLRPGNQDGGEASPLGRRLEVLREAVPGRRAHFGVWIDGCGERCLVVDERGEQVPEGHLFVALASYVLRRQGAVTLIAGNGDDRLEERLARRGARTLAGGATQEEMAQRMQASAAGLGTGGAGEYWFGGSTAPDALAALGLLLQTLSESDRPLSEVVDAGVPEE